MRLPVVFVTLALATLLAGCDQLGIEPASAVAARKEAEGKAVGAGCRHAGRAIEDCYAMNKRADKAAVFAGWREMNDYMRENSLEVVKPQGSGETAVAENAEAPREDKPAKPAKADKADKGAKAS